MIRIPSTLLTLGFFLAAAYSAWLGAAMFSWWLPGWARMLRVLLSAVVLICAFAPGPGSVVVPSMLLLASAVVPMQLALVLADGTIRCDDVAQVRAQPGVSIFLPSTLDELTCAPGDVIRVSRYPRHVWEAPDGSHFVVSTQDSGHHPQGRLVSSRLTGAVCELWSDTRRAPRCLGDGRASAIAELPGNRLAFGEWTGHDHDGKVVVVAVDAFTKPIAERSFLKPSSEVIYDDRSHTLLVGFDQGGGIEFLDPSNLQTVRPPVALPIVGGSEFYDGTRGEGVVCGISLQPGDGPRFLAVAFTGVPFEIRPIGPAAERPWVFFAVGWGCAWDRASNIVYSVSGTLGEAAAISYVDGHFLPGEAYVGPGYREAAFDPVRHHLYLATWGSGDVVALDVSTWQIVGHWSVGRWVRQVKLTRDGHALLATSNLGVVRVALD
jgi:hypothetical protein